VYRLFGLFVSETHRNPLFLALTTSLFEQYYNSQHAHRLKILVVDFDGSSVGMLLSKLSREVSSTNLARFHSQVLLSSLQSRKSTVKRPGLPSSSNQQAVALQRKFRNECSTESSGEEFGRVRDRRVDFKLRSLRIRMLPLITLWMRSSIRVTK